MVTGHFGLDEEPFHGKAAGRDVYLGPQQSAAVARLRKCLAIADAAVAVSGAVGVGKSTLVRQAISEISGRKIVVPVDRMRLEADEILDLLLVRFDVSRQPKGTVQRVAAFRRLLQEKLAADTRVFVVVEDAQRIGTDALLEIEALTSTDGGGYSGADIVLMGDERLSELLADPTLARLRQRVRLRQTIGPFSAGEVEGYMRHCLEAAGGELEQIFERGTAEVVYRYSGGVARVVDNLCESALMAAAEAGLATILPEFLAEVAEGCGLEAARGPAMSPTPVVGPPPAAPAPAPEPPAPESSLPEPRPAESFAAEPFAGAPFAAAPSTPEPAGAEPSAAEFTTPPEAGHTGPERQDLEAEPAAVDADAAGFAPQRSAPPKLSLVAAAPALATGPAFERHGAPAARSGRPDGTPDIEARARAAGHRTPRTVDDASDEIPTLSNSMRIAVLPAATRWPAATERADEAGAVPANDVPSVETAALAEEDASATDETAEAEHLTLEDLVSLSLESAEASDECAAEASGEAGETSGEDALPPLAARRAAPPAGDPAEPAAGDGGEFTLDLSSDEEPTPEDRRIAEDPGELELDALQAAIRAADAWQAGEAVQAEDEPGSAHGEVAPGARAGGGSRAPDIALERPVGETRRTAAPAPDLDRWADELSRAKSLEDISDRLAETLFGSEELQAASAEIRAKKQAEKTGASVPAAASPAAPKARPAPVKPAAPQVRHPAAKTPAPPARPAMPAPVGKRPAAGATPGGTGLTMSQRIEMLNALNKGKPAKRMPATQVTEIVLAESPDLPAPGDDAPETIESQIDTAITQSRKALSATDIAKLAAGEANNDDDGNGKGRGLFGLFRRSSKR